MPEGKTYLYDREFSALQQTCLGVLSRPRLQRYMTDTNINKEALSFGAKKQYI